MCIYLYENLLITTKLPTLELFSRIQLKVAVLQNAKEVPCV